MHWSDHVKDENVHPVDKPVHERRPQVHWQKLDLLALNRPTYFGVLLNWNRLLKLKVNFYLINAVLVLQACLHTGFS